MTPNDSDREIARLFEEQRLADEASAPSYRDVRARGRAAESPVAGRIRRPAFAAAAILLAAAVAFLVFRRPSPPSSSLPFAVSTPATGLPASAASLASWKSPTDVFLRTPGGELMSRSPVLVSPALELAVPAASPPTPNERG